MERQAVAKTQTTAPRVNHVQRQSAGPSAPARPLVNLQSLIGNTAMRRLINSPVIQTKLEVSKPGDPSEQEADRVAHTVMRMPDTAAEDEPANAQQVPSEFTPLIQPKQDAEVEKEETVAPLIQRVPVAVREDDGEEEETLQTKVEPEVAEKDKEIAPKPLQDATLLRQAKTEDDEETANSTPIQRQAEEEEEEKQVQPQSMRSPAPQIPSSVAHNIRNLSGSGSPLPPSARTFFEPRFGADFSHVRVHTDSRAAETAKSLQARAFTVGPNIAFGNGQYSPESQTGRQLLAHELTHVVQQNGGASRSSINPSPATIFRQPGPPPPPPGPPPVTEPMELKGETLFAPPQALADYIKARQGTPIWVAVKFGSLMRNEIPVFWNGTVFSSTTPPPDHDAHPMPITHPSFPIITGARPMLGIKIENDVITGFLGWQTSKALARNPEKFFRDHPFSELFGLEGLVTEPPTPSAGRNTLSGGKLDYHMPLLFQTGEFEGDADVTLKDEKYDFKGEIWVNEVKGIDKPMPLKKEGKKLFANYSWKFNRSLGAAGKLSGEVIGTFAGGKPDVRGTLKYSRTKPEISGTVTVVITRFDIARENVRDELGPDAPTIEPADPTDQLAITGWGHLDFRFNEWLTGNADVIVHPEGYVTAKGEIVPTVVIPILKKREPEEKPFFNKDISVPVGGLDALVADVSVVGSLKIGGYANLGPGTMHDLRVAGLFSSHPGIVNTFELSGVISTPAVAGLKAEAEARIAARILRGVWEPASVGLKITGDLALQLYAEAAAAAGRRKGDDDEPEYFLKGTLKGGAGLRLDLKMQFFGDFAFWRRHIDFFDRSYLIAGGSVTIGFDYVIGKKGKKGEDALQLSVDFGSFNQNEFAEAVLRGKTVGDDKKYAGKDQAEGALETVPNPDAPAPVEPPDPNAPAPPGPPAGVDKTLEEKFTMEGAPHTLKLTLTDPPELAMQTVLEPLLRKIDRARKDLKKDTSLGDAEKASRIAALNKIEASAKGVQDAAVRAAKNPAFITPQIPGFDELAKLIGDYGDAYDVTDLGIALDKVIVDPSKPETVLHKYPGLAADEFVKAQVSRIIAAGVDAIDLRKIVDVAVPRKEDAVLDLIGLIEKMIHGSTNWDKVITDLRIGGNKFKGAKFVISYIDKELGWADVGFEVTNDPGEPQTGRRWDAWVAGTLYQFKSWYSWPDIANRTFLRQIMEDYKRTRVGQEMSLFWVFETSLTKAQIVEKMKAALAQVVEDIKAGKPPKIDGYTEDIANFISGRVGSIVKRVAP